MNSKRKNRLVTLLTIMAVAVCSVFGSPIQAKAAASDIAVLDQLSAQAQYPVVMNLGAYDEATGGVLNALHRPCGQQGVSRLRVREAARTGSGSLWGDG